MCTRSAPGWSARPLDGGPNCGGPGVERLVAAWDHTALASIMPPLAAHLVDTWAGGAEAAAWGCEAAGLGLLGAVLRAPDPCAALLARASSDAHRTAARLATTLRALLVVSSIGGDDAQAMYRGLAEATPTEGLTSPPRRGFDGLLASAISGVGPHAWGTPSVADMWGAYLAAVEKAGPAASGADHVAFSAFNLYRLGVYELYALAQGCAARGETQYALVFSALATINAPLEVPKNAHHLVRSMYRMDMVGPGPRVFVGRGLDGPIYGADPRAAGCRVCAAPAWAARRLIGISSQGSSSAL